MTCLASSVAGLLVSAVVGGMGLPLGVPPATEDPVLSRVAPEQCLFYLSWAGTASPDPKSANQTEQLLAEPEVQNFLTQTAAIISSAKRDAAEPSGFIPAMDANTTEFARCVLPHPGAVFIEKLKLPDPSKKENPSNQKKQLASKEENAKPDGKDGIRALENIVEGGCVLSLGCDAPALGKWMQECISKMQQGGKKIETVKIDGREWHRWQLTKTCRLTFGFYDDYLIAAVGDHAVEAILARMKKEPPRWLADIRKQLPVKRPAVTIYANCEALRQAWLSQTDSAAQKDLAAVLEMFGLSNIRAWIEVWGLDGRDFANKTLLQLDGPPRGLLQLLVDRPLTPEDMTALPRDASFAAAFRLDPQKAFDVVLASLEKMTPEARDEAIRQIEEWERFTGLDLRHGTLKSLGDTWCVYGSPSEGNFFVTGLTAVTPLRDWAGMNVAYGRLMGLAKKWKPRGATPSDNPPMVQISQFNFADNDVYCLASGFSTMIGGVAPSWCMTKQEMIFALTPQNMKAYLSRDGRHEPLSRQPEIAELFSKGDAPAMIAYGDAKHAFEMFYPLISIYGGMFAASALSDSSEVNASLLPSCLSVGRHLGPTVATLRRTPHGVEFVSRGTIPLPSATPYVGLMAWQWFTMFQSDSDMNRTGTVVAPPAPAVATAGNAVEAPTAAAPAGVSGELRPVEVATPGKTAPDQPTTTYKWQPPAAEPESLRLWPQGAPGAKGDAPIDRPTLTVFRPDPRKAVGTAVIVRPGGAYIGLATEHEGREIAEWFNSFGVTAGVLEYRHGGHGYRHPAPLQDAQRAIRLMRAHAADWKISPQRIGIMGFSAGGHLASTAATHFDQGDPKAADPIERISCRPDFLILCYAVIALGEPYTHVGSQENLLGPHPDPALVRSLSSEKQVTAQTPPTFLFHTDADTGVPAENSVQFYLALRRAGVPAELHIYAAGPHGVGLARNIPGTSAWPEQLKAWVQKR